MMSENIWIYTTPLKWNYWFATLNGNVMIPQHDQTEFHAMKLHVRICCFYVKIVNKPFHLRIVASIVCNHMVIDSSKNWSALWHEFTERINIDIAHCQPMQTSKFYSRWLLNAQWISYFRFGNFYFLCLYNSVIISTCLLYKHIHGQDWILLILFHSLYM